jgi:hypothetical protein
VARLGGSSSHQRHISAGSEPWLNLNLMESIDDHGRPLTTTPEASAWYRRAQQSADLHATKWALEKALECEPGFAIASADLSVLVGAGPGLTAVGTQAWERHHIEIVRSVQAGDRRRAVALLADHLSTLACDPIATRIVAPDEGSCRLSQCHPAAWATGAADGYRQPAKPPIEDGPETAGDPRAPLND